MLLVGVFVIDEYISYIEENNKDKNIYYTTFKKNIDYFEYIIPLITILGFISYFMKQRASRGSKFSANKFIFGTLKCDFE